MKTGLSFFFMATDRPGSDLEIYRDEVRLASMAEPMGFDSVWATEHHFTEYSMIPSPLQFLSFMAGKTERVTLGAMVVVLPWHNPARLAGEIGMLDNLSEGRFCLGVGRGLGRLEFEGLGVDMSTSREVFDETAETVFAALENGFIRGVWDARHHTEAGDSAAPDRLFRRPDLRCGGLARVGQIDGTCRRRIDHHPPKAVEDGCGRTGRLPGRVCNASSRPRDPSAYRRRPHVLQS